MEQIKTSLKGSSFYNFFIKHMGFRFFKDGLAYDRAEVFAIGIENFDRVPDVNDYMEQSKNKQHG